MDNYPEEFTELQKRPNEELQGRFAGPQIREYNIFFSYFSIQTYVVGT